MQKSSPCKEHDTMEPDLKDKRHRMRSERGLQMDLDDARKKRNRTGNALKKQIEFVDNLLRQSRDIIALTAGLEGLQMKMDSFKSLHETIGDELLSRRSCSSIRTDQTSTSKHSAADAAALQVKMNSLKRQQELDRKQELLKHQQMELKRLDEREHLQGELEAAKARRDILEKLIDKTSFKAIEDLGSNVSETNSQRQENEKPKRNGELLDNIASVPMSQGGVWERQIRTIRSVLTALLEKNGSQLNDEALQTFMCEAEAVVNSRPLTTGNTTSSASPEALTPNHFLTMKTKINLPPPGVFQDADKYSRSSGDAFSI